MIDVKELRIGNFLSYKGRVGWVDQINLFGGRVIFSNPVWPGALIVGDDDEHAIFFCKDPEIDDVQLTMQILLASGAEETDTPGIFELGAIFLQESIPDASWILMHFFDNQYVFAGALFRSVHELQNLYFAIAGAELKMVIPSL